MKKFSPKKFIIMILTFTAAISVWILWSTVQGEGLTLDAVKYNGKANVLISSIVTKDYEKAAKYLVFSGTEDKDAARRRWIEQMKSLEYEAVSEEHSRLMADDGFVSTDVVMNLKDDGSIAFGVAVQENGLGINYVYYHYKGALVDDKTEIFQSAMTSWNPG